jgi:hypothetical protein
MNSSLKDDVYKIPYNIIKYIENILLKINGKYVNGIERAKQLVKDKQVTYGQLKRIIHDLKYIDKLKEGTKYQLYGGDLMVTWSKNFLDGERKNVYNTKNSRKNSDEIGGLNAIRKNNFNKTHKKNSLANINMKSNKSTISSLTNNRLQEEINKIKKLIK